MHTRRIQFITSLAVALFIGACGLRPCQTPLEQTPTSLTQYPWKLVATNSLQVQRRLSADTFLIYQFASNLKGTLKTIVLNNEPDENSKDGVSSFDYFIPDRGKNIVCLAYQPGETNDLEPLTRSELESLCKRRITSGAKRVFVYSYQLSRTGLTLTDQNTGESYIFRDYRGAIAPDDNCKP